VWIGGCTGPSPLKPKPPVVVEGPCGALPAVFNPLEFGLTQVGTDTTLDLATWNLEFFPLRLPGDYECPHPVDSNRVTATADLINLMRLDVIAVEEISDPAGFQNLLDLCPGYEGILAAQDRGCNFQRVGLIYRSDQVAVRSTRLLFEGNTRAFPRAPLQADLRITSNGISYDLNLIVIHLKASGSFSSRERRREATALLRTYLDDQAVSSPGANFLIAGDWNDTSDDPPSSSSFPRFLDDPENYEFLTQPLAGQRAFASHPFGGGSLIDLLLVNRAACEDFDTARVTTLRLDGVVDGYDNISDHMPVMVQAPLFK